MGGVEGICPHQPTNGVLMSLTLGDRVIIVTGAGSGIGRATAVLAAEHGAHVLVQDLSANGAEETVSMIQKAGGAATAAVGDVSDQAAVDATVEAAVQAGKLGGLVNNAGIMDNFAPAARTTDDMWQRVMRVNV